MTGIAAVQARIASIEARFGAPPGFAAALAGVQDGSAGGTGAVVGPSAARAAQDVTADVAARQAAFATRAGRSLAPSGRSTAASWASNLPERGRPWAADIEAAAREHGVEPSLLAGLVWAESGFRPSAVSHAGAIGLGQLMPGTAAGLGVDPTDPQDNLRGAARYLRMQLDRFGSEDLALAAYNAGPGRVERAGGIPNIAETQAYVPRVLGYRDRLEGRP